MLLFSTSNVLTILQYSLIIGAICYALVYGFEAAALFTLAGKNGFKHRWMAFVPFLNTYYIGVLSDKNKIFNFSAKTVSLVTAICEEVYSILSIIFYVAMFELAAKGYLGINYTSYVSVGETMSIATGFKIFTTPANLVWAEWIASNFQNILLWWIELVYLAFNIVLLILFFQTYAARHYILFAICSIFFPLKGILFFVVRGNKGVNYRDFVREQQARRYAMYQEYNRQQMNNPYNYNPYSGRTQPPPTSNPYEQQHSTSSTPSDPFEEFSNSSNNNSNSSSNNSSNNSSGGNDPFDFN
jgi:hypothetical protein